MRMFGNIIMIKNYLSKNLLKQIKKPLIRAAVFSVISLAACLYFAGQLGNISDAARNKRAILFLSQNSQEQFALLKEDFQKISPYVEKVENLFPSSENLLPFINAMENLAVSAGVQQSFRFESAGLQLVPSLNLNKITFNVIINGNMGQFLNYLQKLEKIPYFTQIDSLSLTTSQNLESQGQMTVRGSLYVK